MPYIYIHVYIIINELLETTAKNKQNGAVKGACSLLRLCYGLPDMPVFTKAPWAGHHQKPGLDLESTQLQACSAKAEQSLTERTKSQQHS